MGLIMLVLIGLVPATYALNLREATGARTAQSAAKRLKVVLASYHPPVPPETLHELDTQLVAMATIGLADVASLPVSTTHVLSSGVAGTMWANRSGIQMITIRKIGLAWILTLPGSMLLSAALYPFGHLVVGH